MDWCKSGLCIKGTYTDSYIGSIECLNCKPIENLINSIGGYEDVFLYRSLSSYEKEVLNKGIFNIFDDSLKKRGYLLDIPLDSNNYSLQSLLDYIFYLIRVTENNNQYRSKLYSYSKSFIIPLLCYIKKGDLNPIIVAKREYINSFKLVYSCNYFSYLKDSDGNHYLSYDSEKEIPIKDLFNNDNISIVKKNFLNSRNRSYLSALPSFIERLNQEEDFSVELADFDSIENVRIRSFTIDISSIPRKVFEDYYKKCSNSSVLFKKVASFRKDREVISTESGCFTNSISDYIIRGRDTIALLQAIVISILFLKMYSVNKYNEDYIKGLIHKLKLKLPIFDSSRLNVILSSIEKNYVKEAKVLWEIVYSYASGTSIICYIAFIKSFCISDKLVNDIVSGLDDKDTTFNVKFDFSFKGV